MANPTADSGYLQDIPAGMGALDWKNAPTTASRSTWRLVAHWKSDCSAGGGFKLTAGGALRAGHSRHAGAVTVLSLFSVTCRN